MLHFLTIGIVLGLSAGLIPGPLLTLVITETLQYDVKAGIRVSIVPIITDAPIIIAAFLIIPQLTNFHNILGIISIIGAFLILYMGYESITTQGIANFKLQNTKSHSFTKGMLVNILSPNPYLFWFTVGTPILAKAMVINIFTPFIFIFSFYICLVSTKIILAILVNKSKTFLVGNLYLYTMRFLGLMLCILAIILFLDGLNYVFK